MNKILVYIYIYILELSYSAILPLELHYSTIANFFAIVGFYKSNVWGVLGFYAKFFLHMAYAIPNVNALRAHDNKCQLLIM